MTGKLDKEKGCRAHIVLGDHLSKTWSSCGKRFKGLCCKDCSLLKDCQSPCSRLYLFYGHEARNFDFSKFTCEYFLGEWDALIKRLGINEVRGIR